MSQFEIFGLAVGGGTLALSPMPGQGGEYQADLEVVRRRRYLHDDDL